LPENYEVWVVCSQPNGQTILSQKLPQCQYLALDPDLLTAAKQLQKADFDLLHYWEVGTDSTNYFLPFFKTARLQVTSWGWPVTSGMGHLNAFISCPALEPEQAEQYYTEPLILCERLPIYYPAPPVPESVQRSDLGLNEETHVYLCAQNLRKIQPDMDPLFDQILAKDPQGQLFFIADKRPAITARFRQRLHRLISQYENRMHILDRMEAADYLRWVKAAHVMLDTTGYTGGANTNYDAFQAGTPVVTLAGPMHRSRFTLAAYSQMGYTDCVTATTEAYVRKAVELATQPELREAAVTAIENTRGEVIEDGQGVTAFTRTLAQLL
jgi:protein O-GlcNAc transferase